MTDQTPPSEGDPPSESRDPRPSDAIRVVGAENAADAATGKPEDRPEPAPDPRQFGAVPVISAEGPPADETDPQPPADAPAPMASPEDDTQPAPAPGADGGDLPHWTDPPSGQVPVVGGDGEPDDPWATSSGGARWRGQGDDWEADDFADLAPDQADPEQPETAPASPGTPSPEEGVVEIDDLSSEQPEPTVPSGGSPQRPVDPYPSDAPAEGLAAGVPAAASGGGDRDMRTAIAVGVGLAAAFLVGLALAPAIVVAMAAAVACIGTIEFFEAARKAGYQPVPLIGIIGSPAMVLAVYWRGEPAFPLIAFLLVVTAMVWFVLDLGERAVPNIGITLFGTLWVGGLASFAALLLKFPEDGTGMLFGAVLVAVAADTVGLFAGQRFGSSPLSDASPNKTVEGLLAGLVAAVVVAFIGLGVIGVHPWDTSSALALGVVGGVLTPLGDLCQSRVKRDLGVKDMGSILPGHGGLLDRFDGLLFVLPAAYYIVRAFEVFLNT